jgi:RNA polymerase sigma-70 factor (ECF subfamily)
MKSAELDNETALIRMTQTGCAESFRVLVNRYRRRIYHLSYAITRNAEDAEDVMQETFLKAYASIRNFRGESRVYTWLVHIARNEALTKLRRRRIFTWVSLDEPARAGESNAAPRDIKDWRLNPEDSYGRRERRAILAKALEDLAAPMRIVFALRYIEGLSCEETAQALGLSTEAVKARALRARRKLQRKMTFRFENSPVLAAG